MAKEVRSEEDRTDEGGSQENDRSLCCHQHSLLENVTHRVFVLLFGCQTHSCFPFDRLFTTLFVTYLIKCA